MIARTPRFPRRSSDAQNLVQPFQHLREFFWGRARQPLANAFGGERANLADLDPRSPGELRV